MSERIVIAWVPCRPLGEQAIAMDRWSYKTTLGHVWPVRRAWCASDAAGRFLGRFRTQEQARRRVVQGQVLDGKAVLMRSKG
ncbi:MAG TPA: hypothetical protein VJ549_00605 [Geothrix sp.]|nr:hypothetical protein [Geothrix sp.]HJV47748.1 hypothetical protein [Geothrix sp.]